MALPTSHAMQEVLLDAPSSGLYVPVPHMVHQISSAPSARCAVWQCAMCGVWHVPGGHCSKVMLVLAAPIAEQ